MLYDMNKRNSVYPLHMQGVNARKEQKEKEIYDALALTDSDENSENKLMSDKVYDETEEINAANKNAAESIGDAISNTDNVIELNKVDDDGEDKKQEEAVQ